jgi:gliding motility-associated-like protein
MSFDDFDFPNVITANLDGKNDELDIKKYFMTCDEFTLQIFNRWGNLVWTQSQQTNLFNGKDLTGKDLVDGIYFFKLIFEKGEKSGFLHIVR